MNSKNKSVLLVEETWIPLILLKSEVWVSENFMPQSQENNRKKVKSSMLFNLKIVENKVTAISMVIKSALNKNYIIWID